MHPAQRPFEVVRSRRRAWGATTAACALAVLLSGCSSSTSPKASSDSAAPTVSASPSPNATVAAETKLLAAYQGFWNIQVQAYTNGSLNGIPVNKYALGSAFYDIEQTLQYYQQNHEVMRGRPVLTPQVTSLQMSKAPFAGTIADCIDTSNFLPVDTRTGKPAQLDSNVHRHPWTFTASFDNVQWYITSAKIDRSKTC